MKKNKHKTACIILNTISLICILMCVCLYRHKIIRKFNTVTEKTIAKLDMSEEDKLNDFNYLFDSITSSVPADTLDELNNLYNIDFVERHDTYVEMIKVIETDLEFFAVMRAIIEDVPTFHTDLLYPDYEYYKTIDCWNIDNVLDTRYVNSKAVYWNTLLKEECSEYFNSSLEYYTYSYDASNGNYVSDSEEILLEINEKSIDSYVEETSPNPIVYDFINKKAYRKWFDFYAEPYSDTLSQKCTIKIQHDSGRVYERTVYRDITADVLNHYAKALGVRKSENTDKTVNNQPFYSFCDTENDVLYMNIAQMTYLSMSDIPAVLKASDNENIIIDLRNNVGGYFSNVEKLLYPYLYNYDIKISNTWYMPDTKYTKKLVKASKKELDFKKSSNGAENYLICEDIITLKGNAETKSRNVYVLISGKTASAADGFVAALKNNNAAVIIGTNTAGEGRMTSFLADSFSASGLVFIYMPELAYNSDGNNNAVYGTAPDIYVQESSFDENDFAGDDPYVYENRLKWDNVLIKALELIKKMR